LFDFSDCKDRKKHFKTNRWIEKVDKLNIVEKVDKEYIQLDGWEL